MMSALVGFDLLALLYLGVGWVVLGRSWGPVSGEWAALEFWGRLLLLPGWPWAVRELRPRSPQEVARRAAELAAWERTRPKTTVVHRLED